MNKREAFSQVRRAYGAAVRPARMQSAGLVWPSGVMLLGHEEPVAVVVYGQDDLATVFRLVVDQLGRANPKLAKELAGLAAMKLGA